MPKQAKALRYAQRVMFRIDDLHRSMKEADQTDADFNKTVDSVVVANLELPRTSDNPFSTDPCIAEGKLVTNGVSSNLEVRTKIAGFPSDIDANIGRTESVATVEYIQAFEGAVVGPNTTRITLDKASGEVDIREYYLGIIPAKLDI